MMSYARIFVRCPISLLLLLTGLHGVISSIRLQNRVSLPLPLSAISVIDPFADLVTWHGTNVKPSASCLSISREVHCSARSAPDGLPAKAVSLSTNAAWWMLIRLLRCHQQLQSRLVVVLCASSANGILHLPASSATTVTADNVHLGSSEMASRTSVCLALKSFGVHRTLLDMLSAAIDSLT